MSTTLVLLDGESRGTLGVVRSLGPLGIPLVVGGTGPLPMSCYSRYIRGRFTYPPVSEDLEGAAVAVHAQLDAWGPAVLMPVFESGWELIHARCQEFEKIATIVPNPGRELFSKLFDKDSLAQCAERHGVPMPRTFRPRNLEEALALRDGLSYPVLLKPPKSYSGIGMRRADTPAALERDLRACQSIPLIQEHIEGEDLELTILCNRGSPVAGSAYLSLRHLLPYGPPVACRTIRDELLMETGSDFLSKLGYHGVAHLDFRRDRRDGKPKLLDFNPRLAGTNEISMKSGVNFPLMLYRMALGLDVESCFDYEVGLEFRWLLFGEITHLAQTPHKLRDLESSHSRASGGHQRLSGRSGTASGANARRCLETTEKELSVCSSSVLVRQCFDGGMVPSPADEARRLERGAVAAGCFFRDR